MSLHEDIQQKMRAAIVEASEQDMNDCHRHGLPIRFTTPTAIPLWMRMFSTPVWNILNRWLGNYWPPNFIQTETKSHRASYFQRLYKPVTQLKESEAKNPFTNCWMP